MQILYTFVHRLKSEWLQDELPRRAAAIAYYTVFSLPAFAMVVVTIAGWALGEETVRTDLGVTLEQYIGPRTVDLLRAALDSLKEQQVASWVGVIGILILLYAAVNVVQEVRRSLNKILQSGKLRKKRSGLARHGWGFAVSFLLLIIIAVLIIASAIASTIFSMLSEHATELFSISLGTLAGINYLLTYASMTILFLLLYIVLPDRTFAFLPVLLCSVITGALFIGGTTIMSTVITQTNIGEAYGVAASVLILLIWIYYSANVFLLGAEMIDVSQGILNSAELKYKPIL